MWNDSHVVDNLALYLAVGDQIANRKIKSGVPLLLERACYGDFGETMRGMRHVFEAVYRPDWETLADVCITATQYPQKGARLWAINQLAILRDKRSLSTLQRVLYDPAELIVQESLRALYLLARKHQALIPSIIKYIEDMTIQHQETQKIILNTLQNIKKISN